MLAIDTNVVVRFLTRDDPEQAARAVRLMKSEALYVSTSVLLETEWVLRSVYGFAGDRVRQALRGLSGLPNVTLQDQNAAAAALERADQGLDFADALHLSAAAACEGFVTFDAKLVRAANDAGVATARLV